MGEDEDMKSIITKCGCKFVKGAWLTATCEHGREFVQAANSKLKEVTERPTVVCLCGSTRFYEKFQQVNFEETMKGNIVLSVGFYPHSSTQAHGQEVGITPEQKEALDLLHLRKIDLADEILVLNSGGYIGESTSRELTYAKAMGKRVRFLETPKSFGLGRRGQNS